MDCVILDGYTLNPGDLSWAPLERLGCLTIYDRTPPELTAARIGGAEAAMTNKTPIGRAVFVRPAPGCAMWAYWPQDTMWWTWRPPWITG